MASHVVVVDASARRFTVKTSPGSYLNDIRDEACKKFGVPADQYTLKYNQKAIDLSRTIRLSGLPQGAKLDLIQQSRSPTVISVALQLPASENNLRLTQKVPSNLSLWQLLRRFESTTGAGNTTPTLNFTQRAAAELSGSGSSGAGRLNYEMPVLNVMGREKSSFLDLQQTLGQLGLSGSALIRLSFRNSGHPLEEAMTEISQYFKDSDGPVLQERDDTDAHTSDNAKAKPPSKKPGNQGSHTEHSITEEDISPAPNAVQNLQTTNDENALSSEAATGPGERSVLIFSPPSNSTPQAASHPHNSTEYDLTVDQARRYQQQLQDLSRNKRLFSDAEIAEKEKAKSEKLAAIQEVKLRIRMPDQSQIEVNFSKDDTTADLFTLIRTMLRHGDQSFTLRYTSPKGMLVALREGSEKLVGDLGFQGRVLITCTWSDNVLMDARKAPSLKQEWSAKAQALKVAAHSPPLQEFNNSSNPNAADKGKGRVDAVDKESKLKALLNKGLFKKK